MCMRAAALAFSFLIRLLFPYLKSVVEDNGNRSGQNTVEKLRKIENPGYRFKKAQIDLVLILANCNNNSAVPNFLSFLGATTSLEFSRVYCSM